MTANRLEGLRAQFDSLNIDGIFTYKDENRNYLTGFTGNESFAFITKEKAYFITDSRFTEQAKLEVSGAFEILEYRHPISETIKKLVLDNGVKRLGVEEDTMTLGDYDTYKKTLEDVEIVKLNQAIERLRMVKDSEEVLYIAKAAEIADKAFDHILGFIRAGMTEIEIALELEFYMKKLGASALSFTTIAASGWRSALPHGAASQKIVEEGEFLTLDFGCVYNGYCSDMTRTVVIGKASDEQKEIYNTVLTAQEAALKEVKPGMSCIDLDKAARDIIAEKGYGSRFGHGLGHGVGRAIHELPGVNPRSKFILEPGMVITDEPGIYIPSFGGVRIEDLILVTEEGCRVLSKSPKKLIEIGV